MKKIVLILLLLALPLQMSWAAAGAYCRHEQGEQARHLGHHGHQHKDGAGQSHENKDGKNQDGGKAHGDCGYCHGIGGQALFRASAALDPARPASAPIAAAPFYYSSHIPDGPRRPDRHRVA